MQELATTAVRSKDGIKNMVIAGLVTGVFAFAGGTQWATHNFESTNERLTEIRSVAPTTAAPEAEGKE